MTLVVDVSTWLGIAVAVLTIVQVAVDLIRGRVRRTPSEDRPYQVTTLATAKVPLPGPDLYAWDQRMGIFLAALSLLIGAWGIYTIITAASLHLGWYGYFGGSVLLVEAALLFATGGHQYLVTRKHEPGDPLISWKADLTLAGQHDIVIQASLRAMLAIGAIGIAGSSISPVLGEDSGQLTSYVLKGGTGRWESGGRGSQVLITIEEQGQDENRRSLHKVTVESQSYRAELLGKYRNARNTRNLILQLLT